MTTFSASARTEAQDCRLELELSLNRQGIQHEVVILEAATEDDLKKTHRRYFEDLEGLSAAHSGNGAG